MARAGGRTAIFEPSRRRTRSARFRWTLNGCAVNRSSLKSAGERPLFSRTRRRSTCAVGDKKIESSPERATSVRWTRERSRKKGVFDEKRKSLAGCDRATARSPENRRSACVRPRDLGAHPPSSSLSSSLSSSSSRRREKHDFPARAGFDGPDALADVVVGQKVWVLEADCGPDQGYHRCRNQSGEGLYPRAFITREPSSE